MRGRHPGTKGITPAYAEEGVKANSFNMEPVRTTLLRLKPFIGGKADMLWVRYSIGDRREKEEWVTLINLLAEKYRVNPIEEAILLPPPKDEESGGELPIGEIRYLNQPPREFALYLSEITRHVGIFGSTGTGKTTLTKNILRNLIAKGIPFIVFDWERNYRDLVKENKNLRIFTVGSDISPFQFNYFKIPGGLSYKEYVKNLIEIFNKAYLGGAGSDSVLLQVFDKVYRESELPTTQEAKEILENDMRTKKLRGREMLWKQSSLRMLQFLNYGGTGKVYNVKDSYPLEKLLNDQVIFELGALASSSDKRFFIEMFVLWYWLHKESEGIEDEKLKHVLVFEEFHNIVENSKKEDLVQKIFRQIRKYGTSLVIIDQTPSLIPNPIFENLYTKITFSLNHKKNVLAIADAMFMADEERRYIGMLKIGQAICRLMGRYDHPFQLSIPFHKGELNIPDEQIKEHMKDFYKEYGVKNPPQPESEPLPIPTERFNPSPLERIFIEDLLQHPLDGIDARGKHLGLIPRDLVKIQTSLSENGIITSTTIDRKKLIEFTEKGKERLRKLGYKIDSPDGSQGLEHRYFVERIRQIFITGGWFPFKEKSDIDLVIEKEDKTLAIEIETGRNNQGQMKKNIEKLIQFNATGKFVLATNGVALAKARGLAEELSLQHDSIQILLVNDFLKNPPF